MKWAAMEFIDQRIPENVIIVTWSLCESAQIRGFSWSLFSRIRNELGPNMGKYGPEQTPYLDSFDAVGLF